MNDFFVNKRATVAGGTGTIGMWLCRELINRGARVTAISLDSIEYANAVLPPSVTFVNEDLTNFDTCLAHTKNTDLVFDMTGIKGSTLTNDKNYSRMFVTGLKFQTALMDAAAKNQVDRYLYVGSVCSYPRMDRPKHEDEMWNGLPQQNDRYSGMLKRIGELQALSYYEDGTWDGVRIIRPSNVYGPGDDFNPLTAQVIPALIAKALNNNYVEVQGDGLAIRDFIYAGDVAYWACEAIKLLPPCVPVNIGYGHGLSIKNICDIIQTYIPDVEFKFISNSYTGDSFRVLDMNFAEKFLKWTSITSIRDGIKKTIDWYIKNKDITTMKGKYYDK